MSVALAQQIPCQRIEKTLSELDDAQLVERALRDQRGAFEQLYCRHRQRLRATACSIVTGPDLDDVSQRTWIKIYKKLDTLREHRFFYAWANRIMVNTALAFVRRRGRRTTTDIDDLPERHQPVEEGPDADEKARWRALLDKTQDWLEDLEDRDRELFRYFLVDGMTMAEIADQVELSEGGVKTRLFRARQQLRARRDAIGDGR